MCVLVAQLDRALGYGPRCRGFESSRARDFFRNLKRFRIFLFIIHSIAVSCNKKTGRPKAPGWVLQNYAVIMTL